MTHKQKLLLIVFSAVTVSVPTFSCLGCPEIDNDFGPETYKLESTQQVYYVWDTVIEEIEVVIGKYSLRLQKIFKRYPRKCGA